MGLIRRTPSSRKDYRAIWYYVAEDNPAAADSLLRVFDSKLQLLSDFPHAGRRRDEVRRRLRSFPVGEYVIYYRPIRGGIQLIRVVHGARDLRKIFPRRR